MFRTASLTWCAVVCCAVNLSAGQASVQRSPRPAPRPEPAEFTGPAKAIPPPPSAIMMRFAKSKAFTSMTKDDPKAIAAGIEEIGTFIDEDPRNPDFYFSRAALSCVGGVREPRLILSDAIKAETLLASGSPALFTNSHDVRALKARLEFEAGQFEEAMRDLDAAVADDVEAAANVFNDGGVEPRTASARCMWSLPDIEALEKRYPADYRPVLYRGLYLSFFLRFHNDRDPKPAMEAFTAASKLNPSSPLPHYFLGQLQAVNLGGMLSTANASCIGEVTPRMKACIELDDIHRLAVLHLTSAIALDTKFVAAYASRANELLQLKEYRQALRDYDRVIELKPKPGIMRINLNDRALARMELRQYQGAVQDLTAAIAIECEASCSSFDNRANAYMKLGDYSHALADVSSSIKRTMSNAVYLINIDSFRKLYPEYDDVPDDVLCEKLRKLFYPQMDYPTFAKQFLIEAKMEPTFILVDLYLKRGDLYAKLGRMREAEAEYDRVTRVFPKFAEGSFEIKNGKRVRVQQ